MKITQDMRLPHPVLRAYSDDFPSGMFAFAAEVVESLARDQVTLNYTVRLEEPTIEAAVADGTATAGIFVNCAETYFSRAIPLAGPAGQVAFDPGALVGRVEVRPLVWATAPIPRFSLSTAHVEFGGGTVALRCGDLLAIGDVVTISVGREKLPQMDTIFEIVKDDTLHDDQLYVSLDEERIRVLVAPNVHQFLNELRNKGYGRPLVLNSVYLPAVMQTLDALRASAEYEGRRWHRVFTAKCDHLGIKLEQSDLWLDAQKLLGEPFGRIAKTPELKGE